MKTTIAKTFLVIWIVLPFGLYALYQFDIEHGLLWLGLHQTYYLPLASWLETPFFIHDNDIGFVVTVLGRFLAVIFYVLVALALSRLYKFLASPSQSK